MANHQDKAPVHVLMVSFPAQGHIKPLLRFAKCLASRGLFITFSTSQNVGKMLKQANKNATTSTTESTISIGAGHLRFEFFDDGWDDDEPKRFDLGLLMPQLETFGRDSLRDIIKKQAEAGRPVSCIINNPFVPFVLDLAAELNLPGAVFWVQSCAVYATYYHYFHHLATFPTVDQPKIMTEIPGLFSLEYDEVPSFLHPSSPYTMLRERILEQFKTLEKSFCVVVDSFYELEQEEIDTMSKLSPIKPVGPLLKFPIVDANELSSNNNNNNNKINSDGDDDIRGDMWSAAEESLTWLDTQPPASVVYVSFGSVVLLNKDEIAEIAYGLLNSRSPFLWALKPPPQAISPKNRLDLPDGFAREAEGKGLVVQWCPQDRVLAHPSVACFVTHCGWNSSLESLSSGVPVVAFPQWGDQVTNAKMLVEVYGVGVRLVRSCEDLKLLKREDVTMCIEEVTRGGKAEEMKKNAFKWKKAADEAVAEGGSSDRDIRAFVNEIRQMALK